MILGKFGGWQLHYFRYEPKGIGIYYHGSCYGFIYHNDINPRSVLALLDRLDSIDRAGSMSSRELLTALLPGSKALIDQVWEQMAIRDVANQLGIQQQEMM
jgi:hypothetical protein